MSDAPATELIPLWIDSATGHLVLGDQLRLYGGMSEAAALACVASLAPICRKLGNMHAAFTVHGLSLGDLPAHLTCRFASNALQSVSFGVALEDPELIDGWPSRKTSEREVEVIRGALRLMFGSSFDATLTFPWGDVYAGIQDRDGMAHAGLRYVRLDDSDSAAQL